MPKPKEEVYSEEQNAARMLTVDEAREFINQYDWTFAKTMPWCPHRYVVRRNVDNDKFVGFVKLIREVLSNTRTYITEFTGKIHQLVTRS
jgi:hypothetical protein